MVMCKPYGEIQWELGYQRLLLFHFHGIPWQKRLKISKYKKIEDDIFYVTLVWRDEKYKAHKFKAIGLLPLDSQA
jgi:hypothetical protein